MSLLSPILPFIVILPLFMSIHPQDSLTHLGFHWLINKSKHIVSFDESQLTYRMNETIGAVNHSSMLAFVSVIQTQYSRSINPLSCQN